MSETSPPICQAHGLDSAPWPASVQKVTMFMTKLWACEWNWMDMMGIWMGLSIWLGMGIWMGIWLGMGIWMEKWLGMGICMEKWLGIGIWMGIWMGNPLVMKHGVLENRPFSWMIFPARHIHSFRGFSSQRVVILVAKEDDSQWNVGRPSFQHPLWVMRIGENDTNFNRDQLLSMWSKPRTAVEEYRQPIHRWWSQWVCRPIVGIPENMDTRGKTFGSK